MSAARELTESLMLFRIFFLTAVFSLIFNTVRLPFGGLGVSDVFIFGALVCLGLEYVRINEREWRFPFHALWPAALMVLVGGFISSIFAYHIVGSVSITIKTAFVLSLWISMTMVLVRRGDGISVLWTFVGAVAFTSSVALVKRFVTIGQGFEFALRVPNYWERSMGTVGHPVELGFIASVALPLAVGMLLYESQSRKRKPLLFLLGIEIMLIISAIFFAGSVAGWVSSAISLGIVGLILLWRAPIGVRVSAIVLVLVVFSAGVVYLSNPARNAKVIEIVDFNLGRVTNKTGPLRFELMEEALSAISVNPFIGFGMDQTGTGDLDDEALVTSYPIHNSILGGWVGGGILVFVGLVWCYFVVLLTALNTLANGVVRMNWVLIGLGACILGWLVFDQTQSHLYHRYTWLTLGIAFGLGYGVRLTAPASKSVEPIQRARALVSPPPQAPR